MFFLLYVVDILEGPRNILVDILIKNLMRLMLSGRRIFV